MRDFFKGVLFILVYWLGFFLLTFSIWIACCSEMYTISFFRELCLCCAFIAYVLSVVTYIIVDWRYRRKLFFDAQYKNIMKRIKDRRIKFEDKDE